MAVHVFTPQSSCLVQSFEILWNPFLRDHRTPFSLLTTVYERSDCRGICLDVQYDPLQTGKGGLTQLGYGAAGLNWQKISLFPIQRGERSTPPITPRAF